MKNTENIYQGTPIKITEVIAIDSENVANILHDVDWAQRQKNKEIHIFYTDRNQHCSISMNVLDFLQQKNVVVMERGTKSDVKNALDYDIVNFLVNRITQNILTGVEQGYSIISNDRGYELFQEFSEYYYKKEVKLLHYATQVSATSTKRKKKSNKTRVLEQRSETFREALNNLPTQCPEMFNERFNDIPNISDISDIPKIQKNSELQRIEIIQNDQKVQKVQKVQKSAKQILKEQVEEQHQILLFHTKNIGNNKQRSDILAYCRNAYELPVDERKTYISNNLIKRHGQKSAKKLMDKFVEPYAPCLAV